MAQHPKAIKRVIEALGVLPGIGEKSAERLAWFLLRSDLAYALELAESIKAMRAALRPCAVCCHVTPKETCEICSDPSRDASLILVVEESKDVLAFESLGRYRGLYHVLMGRASPLEGMRANHLTVSRLLKRLDEGNVAEVILAMNPDAEGDGTALVLSRELAKRDVLVTKLARGLPSGLAIEYAGTEVLSDALSGRRPLEREEA
ncbi:MAG TPA: recombination mediator RecR [Planctomycetota bacterium]|jgi:recombination protein RecR|nr:recombination mediator RecR [Planctomycetota bacterium]